MLSNGWVLGVSPWVETFGRLHVAMVHFPIALLVLAGVLEGWRVVRRKPGVSPTVVTCVILGAIATVLAAGMGWVLAGQGGYDGETAHTLMLHRWMGVATAGVAVVTALLLLAGKKSRGAMRAFTMGALVCTAMVSVTGHFGGELTYGNGYLTDLLLHPEDYAEANPTTQPVQTVQTVALTGVAEKVSYEKDVKPIFDSACVECHGTGRMRGGLRLNTGTGILRGGNTGPALVAHDTDKSLIIRRVLGLDGKKRMPLDKPALTAKQIATLEAWVKAGGPVGDVKADHDWIAKVEPRNVPLPVGTEGNPVDRLLVGYFKTHHLQEPTKVVEDRVYARRVYLDVIGMLPTPKELTAFVNDTSVDKREKLVDKLLGDDRRYAEHWMTFWNDALRNDYTGPGYIDGGRKAITNWLYEALRTNMPYDQFVTQLVDPVPGSEGFTKGIEWRGAVSASQVPELQASQNISQVFLGINMKCASCHDSFISDWKLTDAYGLAGVYADKPMIMYRCEVDQGKKAPVKFLYPQFGKIDGDAPKAERLAQLAKALTCKEDGRFARTIVNRLWARFMGHGIVEPLDEMDNEPWDPDLLDWLAWDLSNNGYDLKRTIRTILTSKAYQMPAVGMADPNATEYAFAGPVVKRMSAEEFVDAVSQLTGAWQEAPAARPPEDVVLSGRWVWNSDKGLKSVPPGTIYLRKEFTLEARPIAAVAAATCDNRYTLYINGKKVMAGTDWQKPDVKNIRKFLGRGKNVIALEATNDVSGDPKNPDGAAAMWATFSILTPTDNPDKPKLTEIGTDGTWVVTDQAPAKEWIEKQFDDSAWAKATDLGPAAEHYDLMPHLMATNQQYTLREGNYRAVWAKNDRLMTALGRPNREQTVTYRQGTASTLELLELTNGPELYGMLEKGANRWVGMEKNVPDQQELVQKIYLAALGRAPTASELALSEQLVGAQAKPEGVEDLLWSVVMLPEFQLVY